MQVLCECEWTVAFLRVRVDRTSIWEPEDQHLVDEPMEKVLIGMTSTEHQRQGDALVQS